MEAKDFPFPLDTDIEEQVPVKKVVVDSIDDKRGTAKFSLKTIMEKQTVRYMNVPKMKYRCKDGEHKFRVFNMKKYMFACILCPYVRKVYPAAYRFEQSTGKLIHRHTGQIV